MEKDAGTKTAAEAHLASIMSTGGQEELINVLQSRVMKSMEDLVQQKVREAIMSLSNIKTTSTSTDDDDPNKIDR